LKLEGRPYIVTVGNSEVKPRHPRSVAYSVERVLLNNIMKKNIEARASQWRK